MTRQVQDVYIVSSVRTPVGKARGALANVSPDDLLAHVLRGALDQAPGIDESRIGDVIVGCAMPEGEQGMNVARIGSLLAGIPDQVPAVTINRFCSSGVQAIAMAADKIALGEEDIMLAGGTESMTMVPMGGNKLVGNPAFFNNNEENVGIAYGMGITAENVANQWKISREDQDEFSYQSHQKAIAAIENGWFKQEILPVETQLNIPDLANGSVRLKSALVEHDQVQRADTNAKVLAKLRTVFAARGSVTAGNASQVSDGAGAALLCSEKALKEYNLEPIAKFLGFAVAGCEPHIMGIGPKYAIPKVLNRVGLKQDDIDWFELNEAFAAQSLAVIRDLGLDPSKVNPQGGAIALGHPLGATGAIRAATAIHGLRRTGKKYGMVTMCIGTGMGAAGVFEVL